MKRNVRWTRGVSVLGTALAIAEAGCAPSLADTCSVSETCGADADAVDSALRPDSAVSFNSSEGGDGGDASRDGAPDVWVCDPAQAPRDAPCVLADAYGVFVMAQGPADAGIDAGSDSGPDAEAVGDAELDGAFGAESCCDASAAGDAGDGATDAATGDGSMLHPYATLAQALANLGPKTRIYVCNGVYPEAVAVTSPVTLYGGLGCSPGGVGPLWSYTGGAAQVVSPSAAFALSVVGVDAGAVTVEDMSFEAPSAVAPGGSSIAALIAASTVSLVRVTLTAGSGADGGAGLDGNSTPNYIGIAPLGGAQSFSATTLVATPGQGGFNQCLAYGSSAGGDGGLGCAPGSGTPGTATPPAPVVTPGRDGLPLGAPLADGGTTATDDPGADGLSGDGGLPSAVPPYGTLSATGWIAPAGGDGAPGSPGQGGAGGTDPLSGNCGAPALSVGGGGGGAGGCGGAGGHGGQGGGASIALASIGAMVSLQQCSLYASGGGAGGPGGAGQDGQAGAEGGNLLISTAPHTPGQRGGNGAGGSGGAGGVGGVSVGVLYHGGKLSFDAQSMQGISLGPPGPGGAPGPGGERAMVAGAPLSGSDGVPGATGSPGMAASFFEIP